MSNTVTDVRGPPSPCGVRECDNGDFEFPFDPNWYEHVAFTLRSSLRPRVEPAERPLACETMSTAVSRER